MSNKFIKKKFTKFPSNEFKKNMKVLIIEENLKSI